MDARTAIAAHREWRDHFRAAMATREPLDVPQITADDCCNFGRWLFGEGQRQFGHLPCWQDCVDAHAEFHREAAKVAEVLNAGQLLQADKMLAAGTNYAKSSERLGMAVVAMFNTPA